MQTDITLLMHRDHAGKTGLNRGLYYWTLALHRIERKEKRYPVDDRHITELTGR